MPVPIPTPIFRLTHISNLATCLVRHGIYAPNHCPDDGLHYRCIHNTEVQQRRSETRVPCAPGGTVHDYVPFYFGYLSPMLLNLKTGRVAGFDEGQGALIYLVSTCQNVAESGALFVFTEGHGAAGWTDWFNDLRNLVDLKRSIGILFTRNIGQVRLMISTGSGENRLNFLYIGSAIGRYYKKSE